jgi:hypothetical protein
MGAPCLKQLGIKKHSAERSACEMAGLGGVVSTQYHRVLMIRLFYDGFKAGRSKILQSTSGLSYKTERMNLTSLFDAPYL